MPKKKPQQTDPERKINVHYPKPAAGASRRDRLAWVRDVAARLAYRFVEALDYQRKSLRLWKEARADGESEENKRAIAAQQEAATKYYNELADLIVPLYDEAGLLGIILPLHLERSPIQNLHNADAHPEAAEADWARLREGSVAEIGKLEGIDGQDAVKAPAGGRPGEAEDHEVGALTKEALVVSTLADHPDWTDTRIATHVGCSRTSLYEMNFFRIARKAQKAGKYDLPRGSKDKDGNLEAEDDGK